MRSYSVSRCRFAERVAYFGDSSCDYNLFPGVICVKMCVELLGKNINKLLTERMNVGDMSNIKFTFLCLSSYMFN